MKFVPDRVYLHITCDNLFQICNAQCFQFVECIVLEAIGIGVVRNVAVNLH